MTGIKILLFAHICHLLQKKRKTFEYHFLPSIAPAVKAAVDLTSMPKEKLPPLPQFHQKARQRQTKAIIFPSGAPQKVLMLAANTTDHIIWYKRGNFCINTKSHCFECAAFQRSTVNKKKRATTLSLERHTQTECQPTTRKILFIFMKTFCSNINYDIFFAQAPVRRQ